MVSMILLKICSVIQDIDPKFCKFAEPYQTRLMGILVFAEQ